MQLKITTIARTRNDRVNQYIRRAGYLPQPRDADHDIIYNNMGANPAAFQFINCSEPGNQARYKFPLMISGKFSFPPGPALYCMIATTGDGFALTTMAFPVTGTEHGEEIGFITPNAFWTEDLDVQCPFRAGTPWRFHLYCYRGTEWLELAQSSAFDIEMYFFLGPTAVPTETDHVQELIRLTIPTYGQVKSLTWDRIEPTLVIRIVCGLWNLGGPTLQYNILGGPSTYLHGRELNLGDMLRQKRQLLNCYDLAALVCAAFQSLGHRPTNTGTFQQLVPTEIRCAEPWGYIRAGTLFGWDLGPAWLCNNPFPLLSGWLQWLRSESPPWHMPQMAISRSYFERHCVTLIQRMDSEKVIDICHTPRDSAHQLLFNDGRATWDEFIQLRDLGYWKIGHPLHQRANFQITIG